MATDFEILMLDKNDFRKELKRAKDGGLVREISFEEFYSLFENIFGDVPKEKTCITEVES